jgi:hypothetical protein
VSLVSPTELKNYLSGIRLSVAAGESMTVILDGTQGELEAFLGYSIEPDQPVITETVYVVNSEGAIGTSAWPIAAVTSLKASDGSDATYVFTDEGALYVPSTVGTFDPGGYTISYRPGLPPRPLAAAKLLVMRVASREVANMHDDSRLNDSDKNSRRPPKPAIGWQKGEKRSLSKWRRRAGSVYSRPQPWLPDVGASAAGYATIGTEYGGVVTVATPGLAEGDATFTEGF